LPRKDGYDNLLLEIEPLDCLPVCVIGLVSFAAGSLITARLMHVNQVRADSNRVFELLVYHALPGKLPALESRFRDTTSKLLAKHDLKVMGYWVPEDAPGWDNTFVDNHCLSRAGGSEKELGRDDGGPGLSSSDQIRTDQQAGGKGGLDIHASDGFFANEVVPDWQDSIRPDSRVQHQG
jgi:hypothetical protein